MSCSARAQLRLYYHRLSWLVDGSTGVLIIRVILLEVVELCQYIVSIEWKVGQLKYASLPEGTYAHTHESTQSVHTGLLKCSLSVGDALHLNPKELMD